MADEQTAKFRLRESDVITAGRLATRRQVFKRTTMRVLIGVAAALYLILFLLDREAATTPMLLGLIAAVPVLYLLIDLWAVPFQMRRHYRQAAGLDEDVEVAWDAEKVRFTNSRGHVGLAWGDYHRWTENDEMMIFFQSEMLFQVLPKRVLAAEQGEAIRAHVERAGVQKI